MNGGILALDIASVMGWAEGLPGERPVSGSVRLGPPGSSHAERYGALLGWIGARLTTFSYRLVIFEAPLDPRWKGAMTNGNTTRLLIGLPAIVEAVAQQTGHGGHRLREATSGDVRRHMLGCRPKAADAKQMVIAKVREMGFPTASHDEADAILLWHHASILLSSKQ